MSELEKYEAVNKAETFEQLEQAIKDIGADDHDRVLGRRKHFSVDQQVRAISAIREGFPFNALTRSYGIRQQMMYLIHYGSK